MKHIKSFAIQESSNQIQCPRKRARLINVSPEDNAKRNTEQLQEEQDQRQDAPNGDERVIDRRHGTALIVIQTRTMNKSRTYLRTVFSLVSTTEDV